MLSQACMIGEVAETGEIHRRKESVGGLQNNSVEAFDKFLGCKVF